jgi:hypothetical protein
LFIYLLIGYQHPPGEWDTLSNFILAIIYLTNQNKRRKFGAWLGSGNWWSVILVSVVVLLILAVVVFIEYARVTP